MKTKFFLFFAAMLICGSMIAQEPDHHYIRSTNNFEGNMDMKARVRIDGVEQQSINIIEIGVFNGNVVTDSKFVKSFGSNNYYRVNLTIGGNGSYPLTFKLYNHSTGEEMLNYTITDPNGNLCESITWINDASLGGYANPYTLNFVHTFTKDITAYTAGSKDHYYLIASPIGTVSPEAVTNMTSNNFDLYYYDQTQDKEWINYEGSNGNFSLEPGKGYLYANSQDVTLTFKGAPYSGNGEVPLVYDAGVNQNTALIGWNLVGNPFATDATLDKPYYRMNGDGSALNTQTEQTSVAAMEGMFVQVSQANESVTFTPQTRSGEPMQIAKVNIMVVGNHGNVIDNAIVRFDNGATLGKFQLRENSTKVFFQQEGKDYAIVNADGKVGEMPVSFKAEENGTYTLSIDTENVEMNYLHLIDNMTGMDVDLLQTPSYCFEATTRDYASRFRLVFAGTSTDATSNEAFAFYSNGNWIINNPSTGSGVATLQIVDVNGHLLCNEQINGCCNKSLNTAPGVYMLRLINGENVKTQKIVVR